MGATSLLTVECPLTGNAAGQTQHVVANYRPRTTLLLLSR
jgi:hypothetical protein